MGGPYSTFPKQEETYAVLCSGAAQGRVSLPGTLPVSVTEKTSTREPRMSVKDSTDPALALVCSTQASRSALGLPLFPLWGLIITELLYLCVCVWHWGTVSLGKVSRSYSVWPEGPSLETSTSVILDPLLRLQFLSLPAVMPGPGKPCKMVHSSEQVG